MACLVSGFVSLNLKPSGRINIGTVIHIKSNCQRLYQVDEQIRGKIVKVEGELARELPVCQHCGRQTYATTS